MSSDYIPQINRSQTAQRILQATVSSLAQNGFLSTSIGSLAADLKLSKGVIHYHFSSKEILFQETIAYIYEIAFADVRPAIDAAGDDWSRVEQFIRGSVTFYVRRADYILALREMIMNFRPTQHRSYAMKRLEQELDDVAELLVAGQQHGTFANFDPKIMALTLRYALNGMAAKIGIQGYDMDHHAEELVRLFYRGIVRI
jgi:AcrR family transcriptional regulator